MLNRRQMLARTLRGSSLVALGTAVPGFVARTARAAPAGKETILVVVEMAGGNDGLNTVVPYADDLYHKARPTLRLTKDQVVRLDGHVGLHPGLNGLKPLWDDGHLAVVQGVGYPNPDRSHFESMDVWQRAEVGTRDGSGTRTGNRKLDLGSGWLGRATATLANPAGGVPVLHVGADRLPPAVQAESSGAVSVGGPNSTFKLDAGDGDRAAARRQLLEDVSATSGGEDELLQFARRRQLQTLTAVEQLRELADGPNRVRTYGGGLGQKLRLVSGLIARGFGTRIFYVGMDGFDTHADQAPSHRRLLVELGEAVGEFFGALKTSGDANRVTLMTYSEFGRRVDENGSRGTDHGAASCLFLAGAGVKGGVVGTHPKLDDLGDGDLKHHTDFRRVYSTLLGGWLGCDAKAVLGGAWESLPVLRARG